MLLDQDLKELLNLFKSFDVRYLVVGGHAVMRYTEPRYTKDVDLWISTDPKNAGAVFNALARFGAPLKDMSSKDFMKAGYFYQMGHPPLRVDVMMSIPGVEFESCWARRERADVEGMEVPFISKEDLIRSKRASGRPQDLIDVANLEKSEGR